jgi:hypothetical protein
MIPHHERFVPTAFECAGWSNQQAVDLVEECSGATDMVDLAWYERDPLCVVFPLCCSRMPDVRNIVQTAGAFNHYPWQAGQNNDTHGFHFDNLSNFSQVDERWSALRTWVRLEGAAISDPDHWYDVGRERWLCTMGIVLHAVEDFYCHSNWVLEVCEGGLDDTFDPDNVPTWEELEGTSAATWVAAHPKFNATKAKALLRSGGENKNEFTIGSDRKVQLSPGLQTGQYPPKSDCAFWHHRHVDDRSWGEQNAIVAIFGAGGAASEELIAEALARRASCQWLEFMADSVLNTDCRADLHGYLVGGDPSPPAPLYDVVAAENIGAVMSYYVGSEDELEGATYTVPGIGSALLEFAPDSSLAYVPGEGTSDSTDISPLRVVVTDSTAWSTIASAPNPVAAAQALVAAGKLSIERRATLSVPAELPSKGLGLSVSPNPGLRTVRVRFRLPGPGPAKVLLFDPLGREVGRLVDEALPAGTYERNWAPKNAAGDALSPGVYFVVLQTAHRAETFRVVVMR